MKRSSLVLSAVGLAALLSACFPSLQENTPKPNLVIMEFNPPSVVPLPNDLAIDPVTGFIVVPTGPNDTPTQIEFNKSYLGKLTGFPMESTASTTTSGDLNPATLSTGVLVLDITNPAAPAAVTVTPSYVAGSDVLNIPPPGGAWTRGHKYAVTVIGGSQTGAVTGSAGQQVVGSSAWALVSGTTPLCALPDGGPGLPGSGCLATTDLICLAAGVSGSACNATAAQLEEIREGYAPLLNALSGPPFSIPRSNVAILWTFGITPNAEVTFDPANAIIPFPNDALRTGPGGTVSFPIPPGIPPTFAEIFGGLNTLDGFSTTATITTAVDFNIPNNGVSALMQAQIDPSTLTPQLAWGFQMVPGGSVASAGNPQVTTCVSDVPPGCPLVSATLLDGGVKPEILGIVPLTPLNEHTSYAAYLTNSIKDTNGKPVIATAIFGLVRLAQPLAINGKSQVTQLTDAQATQLLPLQQGLAPFFAQLSANGIPRSNVVLAWGFQTVTEVSTLQQLYAAPYATNDGGPGGVPLLPPVPLWAEDVTAVVRPVLTAEGISTANISAIWVGEIVDLFALTGPGGTFNPDGGVAPTPIPFIMTVPLSPAPAGGYPVTMFGHGLTGNKEQSYAISNTLATFGEVMIAIDEVWHGARSTCAGFGAALDSAGTPGGPLPDGGFPDSANCVNPVTNSCNSIGRCQLANNSGANVCVFGSRTADQGCFNAGQNACAPNGHCEGAGSGFNPAYSGWNFVNVANPFASRDNFRQQVIDNSQLARVVSDTTPLASLSAQTGVALNGAKINYSGQSLGSFLGTLSSSVAFNVHNVGLDVAGSHWVTNLLLSPAFASIRNPFIAGLASAGIVQDSPTYDTVVGIYEWILDPGEPANMAYFLTHKTNNASPFGASIPADRRAFVQWIAQDQVVLNSTTQQLIQAAVHDPTVNGLKVLPNTAAFLAYQFNEASTPYSFVAGDPPPLCSRHPFLLAPPNVGCGQAATADGVTLTGEAQLQLVDFLSGVAAPY
jgi:hypothetical protein